MAAEEFPLVVVTGAGARLGRAIAGYLSGCGYAVGLHYHLSAAGAQSLADQIEQAGGRALLLPGDLTDPQQVDALFAQVDRSGLALYGLVNSAAVMPAGRLGETSIASWEEVMALNLRAPWLCSLRAAERMREDGAIVNISDVGARKTWTGYGAYVISKAALEALTRLLARELAPAVRVNAVAPGLVLRAPDLPEKRWQRLVDRLPLQRSARPDEIAETVRFLLESSYITGEVLAADGGYLLN